MSNRPDDFQNRLAGIFIGVILFLVVSGFVMAGLRVIGILDDGGGNKPSEWKRR